MAILFRLGNLRHLCWPLFLCSVLSFPEPSRAQTANTVPGQQVPENLIGVVLNATTNQPVARALVQLGSRAALTESDGKFQFTAASGSSDTLRVTKPGYYDGLDHGSSSKKVVIGAGTDPVKVYLFPEGLITGTLTAPDGNPVPGVYVQAFRKSGDESGFSWTIAGQTSSNSDGQFRLPLSAGDYVVETHYMADQPVRQQAIMPTIAPDPSNGSDVASQPTIHLESGAEQHLELHPQFRPTREVLVSIDDAFNQGYPQIEAHLSNGLSFFPVSRQTGAPGEFLATMPTGSYLLSMSLGDRDGGSYAQASVTVGDSERALVVMHSARSMAIAVELVLDSSSSATSDNNAPSIQQLGLHFVRTSQTAPQMNNQNDYLHFARGEVANFRLLPGSYRLLAQQLPQWYIESATVAGTDLLAHDLDVEAGEALPPLRIVVSNQTSGIKGTVKLDGSPAANCWVYLIAATPGVVPVILIASTSDGSYSRPSLPPGSYRAIAFETRRPEDFSDPATLERLAPYMKSLTITPGETAALDIDAIPTLEPNH
jgi:hypothetical protein